MANNRMWLTNPRTGDRVLLAKYYPSSGWSVYHAALTEVLDSFFEGDKDRSCSHTGETDWLLEYETVEEMKR